MKRSRSKEKPVYVCKVCQEDLPLDQRLATRSNTWAYGMVGVRFLFCSEQCRDKHDDEVRASWKKGADQTEE